MFGYRRYDLWLSEQVDTKSEVEIKSEFCYHRIL